MYKIFQPELLKIESDNNSFILTGKENYIKAFSNNCSDGKIIWNTKDIFNHNYVKYKDNKNLTGLEIKFKTSKNENIINYSDANNIQYLTLTSGDKKYNIPIGFFGKEENFTLENTIVEENGILKLPYNYLKWNSLNVFINSEEEGNNVLIDGKDFDIDYVKGELKLKTETKLPSSYTLSISGQYHSNLMYKINFDRLYEELYPKDLRKVSILDIDCFYFPINVINANESALLEITELEITSGSILKKPSKLKKHNVKLIESYSDINNFNLDYIFSCNNSLGYNDKIIINLENGEYSNLLDNGYANEHKVLSETFKTFLSEIFNIAKSNNKTVQIIVENRNKFLSKYYYCKNNNNDIVNVLNPINLNVVNYYNNLFKEINELNDLDVDLELTLNKFEFPVESDNIYIFDEYTISLFKDNFLNSEYAKNGVNYNKEYLSEDDKAIYSWLSNKVLESFSILKINNENLNIIISDEKLNSNKVDNLLC